MGENMAPLEGQPTAKTFTRHNSDALDIGIPHHGILASNGALYNIWRQRWPLPNGRWSNL